MKLCFLASANSIHSHRWVKYFAERGHQVDWISFSPLAFESIKGVRFHSVGPGGVVRQRPWEILRGLAAVKRLVGEIQPDIFHAHYVGVNGVVAGLCGYHPLVLTAWGSDVLFAGRSRLFGVFIRMALRVADLVTCDANHMAETMVKMGVNRDRIVIVYFGTDTNVFQPSSKDSELAKELKLQGSPVVISLRSFYPLYDVATVVRSVPDVLQGQATAQFLIGGSGPEEPRLRALAESLAVLQNVKFIGMIPNERLPKYFSLADVYVSTALSDAGLSSSTAEAMACGVPVVITDVGDNRKWVESGVSGFVISPKDSRALARRIVQLLENPDLCRTMGVAGRQVVVARNNLHEEMLKIEKLYDELKGRSKREA